MENKRRKFIINEKLPTINDYIHKLNINRYVGNELKKSVENTICWYIKSDKVSKMEKPCYIKFTWHEKTRKRDCDNIASAKKFILDALQKAGIIPNDNQNWIIGFSDKFVKDDKYYVEVELIEVEQ